MVHSFSYIGVPDRFKIIIVTADGETIVSENIVKRKAFNSRVYFDYNTKKNCGKIQLFLHILSNFLLPTYDFIN